MKTKICSLFLALMIQFSSYATPEIIPPKTVNNNFNSMTDALLKEWMRYINVNQANVHQVSLSLDPQTDYLLNRVKVDFSIDLNYLNGPSIGKRSKISVTLMGGIFSKDEILSPSKMVSDPAFKINPFIELLKRVPVKIGSVARNPYFVIELSAAISAPTFMNLKQSSIKTLKLMDQAIGMKFLSEIVNFYKIILVDFDKIYAEQTGNSDKIDNFYKFSKFLPKLINFKKIDVLNQKLKVQVAQMSENSKEKLKALEKKLENLNKQEKYLATVKFKSESLSETNPSQGSTTVSLNLVGSKIKIQFPNVELVLTSNQIKFLVQGFYNHREVLSLKSYIKNSYFMPQVKPFVTSTFDSQGIIMLDGAGNLITGKNEKINKYREKLFVYLNNMVGLR